MLRENETIEFKKSTAEVKAGVVSIVAMLNKHGRGEVYFGIDDHGKVLGQTIGHTTLRDVTQAVVDNTEPKVYPKVEVRQIEGKECIVVEAQVKGGPYFAYGRAYIRVGESDKQLSVQEIKDRFRNDFLWEEEISDKKLKDVNIQMLKEYMKKANEAKRINFKYTNVKTTLNKLWLLKGNKLKKATEALFCDENHIEIQAAVFAGTDKLTFLDISQYKGNLFSLRQQAEVYVKEHIMWRAEIKSGPRKEIPEIPVEAIREAIGNSLCHRDFTNPKGNEVAIFKDRIEIYNPGKFPEDLNPEDFIRGDLRSILRNPLIAETMYKSSDIEKWASGLRRIYEECTASHVKFEFKRIPMGFVVIFYRPKWEDGKGLIDSEVIEEGLQKVRGETRGKTRVETRGKTGVKILQIIKENPQVTIPGLSQATGLTIKGVEWNIKTLKKKELLKRVGPAKGGHWEVVG